MDAEKLDTVVEKVTAYACENLQRMFIDFSKRIVLVTDGFIAIFQKLNGDTIVSSSPINLDMKRQSKTFKGLTIKPEALMACGAFDLTLAKKALSVMDDGHVVFHVYMDKRDNSVRLLALSQKDTAVLVQGLSGSERIIESCWRPWLDCDDQTNGTTAA